MSDVKKDKEDEKVEEKKPDNLKAKKRDAFIKRLNGAK